MSVEELEKAALALSSKDRTRLAEFLAELDAAEWDRQLEKDAANGKLDRLMGESEADFKAGRFREI